MAARVQPNAGITFLVNAAHVVVGVGSAYAATWLLFPVAGPVRAAVLFAGYDTTWKIFKLIVGDVGDGIFALPFKLWLGYHGGVWALMRWNFALLPYNESITVLICAELTRWVFLKYILNPVLGGLFPAPPAAEPDEPPVVVELGDRAG